MDEPTETVENPEPVILTELRNLPTRMQQAQRRSDRATRAVLVVVLIISLAMGAILLRRSPVLAYDRCHDRRLDNVIHDIRLSFDQPGAISAKLHHQIDTDDDLLHAATRPSLTNACPPLPG